jgi:hypothetical protein
MWVLYVPVFVVYVLITLERPSEHPFSYQDVNEFITQGAGGYLEIPAV